MPTMYMGARAESSPLTPLWTPQARVVASSCGLWLVPAHLPGASSLRLPAGGFSTPGGFCGPLLERRESALAKPSQSNQARTRRVQVKVSEWPATARSRDWGALHLANHSPPPSTIKLAAAAPILSTQPIGPAISFSPLGPAPSFQVPASRQLIRPAERAWPRSTIWLRPLRLLSPPRQPPTRRCPIRPRLAAAMTATTPSPAGRSWFSRAWTGAARQHRSSCSSSASSSWGGR